MKIEINKKCNLEQLGDEIFGKYSDVILEGNEEFVRIICKEKNEEELRKIIEDHIPKKSVIQTSTLNKIKLTIAEMIEKQEADKIQIQLAIAELLEVQGGAV